MIKEIEHIISEFDPITLKEMDRVKLMNRVDTKFAIPAHVFPSLLKQLSKDYFSVEILGTRLPFYKSLYFDTDEFDMYHDHHNGSGNRYKVRIRNYTESELFFLEIKHKFKGRTDKNRIKIDAFEENLSEKSLDFIEKTIAKDYHLKATLWNSFNRITLVNKIENERLTLDMNLLFEWKNKEIEKPQLVIAELKQERVDRQSVFFQLMKSNYIRPYRISKYCIGTCEMYQESEELKYNLFKPKLLTLEKLKQK